MKAIRIDPEKQVVEEVEYNGDWRDILRLLNVSIFTAVGIDEFTVLYVNDEGLLEDPEFFFEWEGYPQPLAGRGLVLGTDEEGNDRSPKMSLDEVRKKVKFSRYKVLGFESFEGMTERYGIKMPVFGNRPILQKLD